MMTDPNQALDYINQTGIDCLAVAIGTAHGAYVGNPCLDFERLSAIKARVHIPLVLHGGSGTGDENIAKACDLGINKVNVCNELLHCMYASIVSSDLNGDNAYDFWPVAMDGLRRRVQELMRICRSSGKSWTKERAGLPRKNVTMRE
jgi:fructose-bisphosphate aldolase class II